MAGDWRERTWGEIATLEYGKSLRGYENAGGRFRVYGTNGPIGWHESALCQHPGGQVGWGSTEYIVMRPTPPLPLEFAYCLARSEAFRDFAVQSMTGSSGRQRVPVQSLSHFMVASPSKAVADLFGQVIKALFARASTATQESRSLAALRDTLLPKLISGELRVKDAERFIGRNV